MWLTSKDLGGAAWAPYVEQFLERFGASGVVFLGAIGFAIALIWLTKSHQKQVARLHDSNQVALATQTAALVHAVEGLAAQTEVLRVMKDELRELAQSVRDSDTNRGRDLDRLVNTIFQSRGRPQ